jgi:hypothetical protein
MWWIPNDYYSWITIDEVKKATLNSLCQKTAECGLLQWISIRWQPTGMICTLRPTRKKMPCLHPWRGK